MKITLLVYTIILITLISCKSNSTRFSIYKGFTLPDSWENSKQKLDSLVKINQVSTIKSTRGTVYLKESNKYKGQEYFTIISLFVESQTLMELRLDYTDENGLNALQYEEPLFINVPELDQMPLLNSSVSVISNSSEDYLFNSLKEKYGDVYSETSHFQNDIYPDFKIPIQVYQKEWNKKGLSIKLLKNQSEISFFNLEIRYTLTSEYLKANKELLENMRQNNSKF